MPLSTRFLKQDGVYWAPKSRNQTGKEIFYNPIPLKIRWDDSIEQFTDTEGKTRMSKAQVLVPIEVEIGGYIFKGELDEVEFLEDPRKNPSCHEIRHSEEFPMLIGKNPIRIAYLI